MPAPQIFKVLTEFRFETGAAIAQTGKLQEAVEGVSNAADSALLSFQKMSIGMVSGMLTGPGGGILGLLATAVNASEAFTNSQVALANVLGKSSGKFATRMAIAEQKMRSINRIAKGFALPSKDLVAITKVLTPALKTKMPALQALNQSVELGRFFLKAAPTLNIDPGLAIGQLQRAILGYAGQGDTLFRVLTADTKAMGKFVGKSKEFNNLPLAKRVETLVKAFKEFGSDADVLARLTNSVSGQMRILKDNLVGMFSVLKPLGDVLSRVVVQALQQINKLVGEDLRKVLKNIAFAIEPLTRDLKTLFATLVQLKSLRADLNLATDIVLTITALLGLGSALDWLGVKIPVVNFLLKKLAAVVGFFEMSLGGAVLAGPMKGFFGFFNKFFIFVTRALGPLALLVFVFQLLSRAAAFIKIEFADKIRELIVRLSGIGATLSRFIALLLEGFDALARVIAVSPMLKGFVSLLETALDALEFLVNVFVFAVATFNGLAFAILEFIEQVKQAVGLGGDPAFGFGGGDPAAAFDAGMEEIFKRVFGEGDEGIPQSVININKVEQRFDFKEKIEPDRVAFTVVDQLKKAAANRTGAQKRSGTKGVVQ
jgi:hypothetical protein